MKKHLPAVLLLLVLLAQTGLSLAAEHPLLDRLRERRAGSVEPVAGTQRQAIQVTGEAREYLLHVPPGLSAKAGGRPVALVLCFHGYGSDMARQEQVSGFSGLADEEGFLVAYPQGLEAQWRVFGRTDADVRFVEALVAELGREYPVDPARVYAAGISNGALMAWRLAMDRPALVAACGLVSGGYPAVSDDPSRPPLVLFHGTEDRLLPYEGREGRVTLLPVREFARKWAARPGCAVPEQGEPIPARGDATGERWACAPGKDVELYTLRGKGHSWPGSAMPGRITSKDLDATRVMWAFFAAHPRQ